MMNRYRRPLTIILAFVVFALAALALNATVTPWATGAARAWGALWSCYFLAFSLVFTMSLRRGQRLFVIALWTFVLTYGAALTADVLLERQIYNQSTEAWVRRTGAEFDGRSQLEVITDLRNGGLPAVPALVPEFYFATTVLPLGGIANAMTVFCNESGEYTIYRSDRYGFNNADQVWDAQVFDAVILGDSFVQGACVPAGSDIASLVRREFPATVGLGMSGAGPYTSLAQLREFASARHPRFVFWLYYEGNDADDADREYQNSLLRAYLDPEFTQGLVVHAAGVDLALRESVGGVIELAARRDSRFLTKATERLIARHMGNQLYQRFFVSKPLVSTGRGGIHFKAAAEALAAEAANAGRAQLVFVYLPGFGHASIGTESSVLTKPVVLDLIRSLGLPVIDIEAAFKVKGDLPGLYALGGRGHYSPEGYLVVAGELLKFMRESAP